jgi:RecA-family ATPase
MSVTNAIEPATPEIPWGVAEALSSWRRTIDKTVGDKRPNFERAALELMGLRIEQKDPFSQQVIVDAVHEMAEIANVSPDEAQGMMADALVHKQLLIPAVRASPFVYHDPTTIPRREFLFGRHAVRKFVSVTAAAGGTGKTALTMVETTGYITGRDLLNDHLLTSGRALYIGLEDPYEEYERRTAAILLHYKIDRSEIEGGLFLDSGRTQDFVIARENRGNVVVAVPTVEAITQEIIVNNISLVTVDPFVACHNVRENDNTGIEQIVRQWKDIADKTGCAIDLVHHIRKLGGEELTAEGARGAKALVDAARSVRLLTGMTKEEVESLGLEDSRRYFRVTNGKANLYLPPDKATWRQLVSVPLGNGGDVFPGDQIQVAAIWNMPKPTDGVSGGQVDQVIAKIRDGEYRASSQARNWAGLAVAEVLGLDLDRKADKARVAGLLKLWIENGALAKERRQDEHREEREFIVPGKAA